MTTVELDGRLGHEGTGDRWADLERDLVAAGIMGTWCLNISGISARRLDS